MNYELTKGNYDVANIIGVDEKNKKVYFIAAYHSPLTKDFCSVGLDGNNFKLLDERIGSHSIKFNADFTYYTDDYSTITQPNNISVFDINGKLIRTLKDNSKLAKTVAEYGFANAEFIKIPTSKGETLNGWILKPTNFDAAKKYPVLFCNYGGPVRNRLLTVGVQ